MVGKKSIAVIFDSRSADFDNGKQYQSLIDQMNAVLQSGERCHSLEITQWQLYHEGNLVKGEDNVHIPFHRHFYHDREKNVYGGGFMLFEVREDLNRYYRNTDVADALTENIELVFTVTATLA